MAVEQYVDFSAATTIAVGGYTAGSGVLNVASTSSPFPASGNFSVVITDASTGATKVLLRVTAKNSSTQWAVTAEGTDANASASDNVYAVLSALSLDGIRADQNQFGTRANLPSTTGQKKGNRYKCTDSPYEFIFDGSAWQPFFMGVRVVEPVAANFSWNNQGGASIITSAGGILLACPPHSGDTIRSQLVSYGSAPFTVDMAFMPGLYGVINFASLLLSDGTKFATFVMAPVTSTGGAFQFQYDRWNTNSSYNSTPNLANGSNAWPISATPPLIWLRLYDDGVDRNIYYSVDGVNFVLLLQESNTAFLTPTKVGFGIDLATSISVTSTMWVVHWNLYSGAPPATGYSV